MYFNIDADDGHIVRGWLVLDNPSTIPSITVIVPGRDDVIVEANVHRPDVQELGIHVNGMVGFAVTPEIIPGLESLTDIAIVEAGSRLPLFRRAVEGQIEKKLYLFDSSILPQSAYLSNIPRNFNLNYISTERFPLETMLVMISNSFSRSMFFFGRSNFNRYSTALNNAGFLRAALLREPFEELAERLMYFRIIANAPDKAPPGSIAGFEPLLKFAQSLPMDDPKKVLQAFRKLDDEQRRLLESPMTRLYGCNFDEFPDRRHVPIALENLASMDVVGTKAKFGLFRALLAAALSRDVIGDAAPPQFALTVELGKTLANIGLVADLLECDIDLYNYSQSAIETTLSGSQAESSRDHSI